MAEKKIIKERRGPTWDEANLRLARAKELIEEWRRQGRHYANGLRPALLALERCLVNSGDLPADPKAPSEIKVRSR